MRSSRGSRYRGVSRNGHKWQVMIVKGSLRKYIGGIETEEEAARFYDKYAIIMQGLLVSFILVSKNVAGKNELQL